MTVKVDREHIPSISHYIRKNCNHANYNLADKRVDDEIKIKQSLRPASVYLCNSHLIKIHR